MKKKCQIHLIETNKETSIHRVPQGQMYLSTSSFIQECKDYKSYYLYITSDDEIKENDYHYAEGEVQLTAKETLKYLDSSGDNSFKKVIATTDNNLKTNYWNGTFDKQMQYSLPQPSESFIKLYIDEYNKGNVIKEAMVEYEFITTNEDWSKNPVQLDGYYISKVGKNNQITITRIKDSWNREEVINNILQFKSDLLVELNRCKELDIPLQKEFTDNWINDNI